MTAGIYLVSACESAEDFVAAFRRYADRTGLFVPSASPLPQGKKGRFALTLKDGGVMLEGEAEVVQSSAKSPLHGRAGMMLKFTDLDEPSKTVLAELEKARLAMKPAPPSVPPRPADVPAEPRPVVPAIGGRIDAANALAECVVIGDVGTLEEAAGGPPKAGPKFVVPTIPAFGGRPKSPTTPPEGTKPPEAARPPESTKAESTKAESTKAEQKMTTIGMPAIRPPGEGSGPVKDPTPAPPAPAPKKDPTPIPVAAAPKKDPTPVPVAPKRDTAAFDAEWDAAPAEPSGKVAAPAPASKSEPVAAPAPASASKSAPIAAAAAPPPPPAAKTDAPAPPAAKTDPAAPAAKADSKASAKSRMTQIGFPVVKPPAEPGLRSSDSGPKATTLGVVPLRATEVPSGSMPAASSSGSVPAPPKLPEATAKPPLPQPTPTRSKSPTAPPRHPTPFAPLPVAKLPAKRAPALGDADVDEKTDLTNVPLEPDSALIESKPPMPDPEPERKPVRSGGMRASEIMAAVHAEDWTMAPDAPGPTVLPADKPPDVPEPTPSPGAPPTGDWTMSLDPAAGWSKPEKVDAPPPISEKPTKIEKRNPVVQTPASGNPVKSVSSDKPIEVQAWEDKPTSIGAKIEVDATLMEPLDPMPAIDDDSLPAPPVSSSGMGAFPRAGSMPGMPPPMQQGMPMQAGMPMQQGMPTQEGMPMQQGMPPFGSPYGSDAPPPFVPNATGPESAVSQSLLQAQPPPLPLPPPPGVPMPQEIPIGYAATLLPGQMMAPPAMQYATAQPGDLYRSEALPATPVRSNKKLRAIVAGAVLVVVMAVVLALTLGGKKKHAADKQHVGKGSGSAVVVMTGSGEGSQAVVVPDLHGSGAGSAEETGSATHEVVTPPKAETCAVEVTTTPAGAEVSLDDKVLGPTPGTFQLPCGTVAKLKIQKAKYLGVVRQVTPTAAGTKLAVTLGQGMFSIKITSTPAGASITVAGKAKGVTPTAVQLPAFQTVTITLSKEGYSSDTEKVVIKANGQSHHVVLKKAGRTTRPPEKSHGLNGI